MCCLKGKSNKNELKLCTCLIIMRNEIELIVCIDVGLNLHFPKVNAFMDFVIALCGLHLQKLMYWENFIAHQITFVLPVKYE